MNPLHHRSPPPPFAVASLDPGLRVRLEALFDHLVILSPQSLRFAGGAPLHLPGAPAHLPPSYLSGGALQVASPPAGAAPGVLPLVSALLGVVYASCYARVFDGAAPPLPALTAAREDAGFIARVAAANHGRLRWDPAWRVHQMGVGGAVHVSKGDRVRVALPGEYAFAGTPGRMPRVGETVDLLVLPESRIAQGGFYYALGETVAGEADDAHLARLYFHARASGVPAIIGIVTDELNAYQVPFRMKCLSSPDAYDRTDAAVLYVARRYLGMTLRALAAAHDELAPHLLPGVPLCSKELIPGLGAADEPATGESFGQARSRLLAEGMVDAWQRGSQGREARFLAASERFARAGLSLDKPYLNEGMADVYAWPDNGAST